MTRRQTNRKRMKKKMRKSNHYDVKGMARVRFIWDYYKLPIFLICAVIYASCYLIYRNVTAEYPQLYLAYVNIEIGETLDHKLTEEFIQELQPAEKHSVVKVMRQLALTENLQQVDGSYVYASQMKILAAIDNQQLDIVLMNQEAFDAFAQNGLLVNLDDFARAHELTYLDPWFVENIEILSDNATDIIVDPSVEYHSETVTYPMGIEITEFPPIQEAGFPDRVYLGIIKNTERADNAASFISYISSDL